MTQWGLDNLFNPGKRHMDDEKRRLQSTREDIGDNSGGRRIDLEGGTVSISIPGRARTAAPADEIDETEPADDTGVFAAALEAEDLPAVALASDAEIEPDVVEETEPEPVVPEVVEAKVEPEPEPAPEPVAKLPEQPAPPRRRAVSASTWSRQG